VAFHDLETNERIQIDPAYVRDAYREQIREFIENYRRRCAESNIDYIMADTSTPYDFMLTKYIAKRNRL
jgi:MinD-like ATPase involved in chromosome partitioning or flagellar assembly